MDERTLFFRFEFDQDADGDALAREVEDRLARLESVAQAEADVDRIRLTGAEVVAAIAVGVVVVRGAREFAHEINLLLQEMAQLVGNIRGLRSAYVEVDGKSVALREIDEEDVATLSTP